MGKPMIFLDGEEPQFSSSVGNEYRVGDVIKFPNDVRFWRVSEIRIEEVVDNSNIHGRNHQLAKIYNLTEINSYGRVETYIRQGSNRGRRRAELSIPEIVLESFGGIQVLERTQPTPIYDAPRPLRRRSRATENGQSTERVETNSMTEAMLDSTYYATPSSLQR